MIVGGVVAMCGALIGYVFGWTAGVRDTERRWSAADRQDGYEREYRKATDARVAENVRRETEILARIEEKLGHAPLARRG